MAEKDPLFKSNLTCSVCTEIFKDPVTLGCHHSFCSGCLQDFWDQAKNKNCPICKMKSTVKNPPLNKLMKNMSDFYSSSLSGSSSRKADLTGYSQDMTFCKDEQRAERGVDQFPHGLEQERAQMLKQQLRSDLTSVRDMRNKYLELEKTYDDMVPHLKKQLVKTERKIRAQFEQLHQFLREEEEARVAALREEEEEKRKMILKEKTNIQKQISSLSAAEEDLEKYSVSFLTSYNHSSISARTLCSGSGPQLLPGGLLDEAKHLGNLAHKVWGNVEKRIKFTPVILDPNTAAYSLSLSDDLTSMRRMDEKKKGPDNPERFAWFAEVLGSEGFSSGRHCWEVEVGDHPAWSIGVVKESVDRKGKRTASPDNGMWCLFHESGEYYNDLSEVLTLKRSPEKIQVQLDYDGGEVSFYDPEDMTLIYTYEDTFTENIYPYFSVAGKAQTTDIKVCASAPPRSQL